MGAKEDHATASSMAEWLGLEGDEIANFVKGVMERKGHKPVLSWEDSDDGGKGKGGSVLDGLTGGGGKKGPGWNYGG